MRVISKCAALCNKNSGKLLTWPTRANIVSLEEGLDKTFGCLHVFVDWSFLIYLKWNYFLFLLRRQTN